MPFKTAITTLYRYLYSTYFSTEMHSTAEGFRDGERAVSIT
jgi:hypothetical protein